MRLRKLIGEIGAKYDRQLPMSSPAQRLLRRADDEFRRWVPSGHLVAGGGGDGEPAVTPRITIFNPQETTTIRRGLYLAYVFAADMSTVTLTLNQGIGEMADHLGRAGARKVLAQQAATIRAALGPEDRTGLETTFDLRTTAASSVDYEQANIVSLTYRLDDLPAESQMRADLQRFVRLYALAREAREVARRQGRHEVITPARHLAAQLPDPEIVPPAAKRSLFSKPAPTPTPSTPTPAKAARADEQATAAHAEEPRKAAHPNETRRIADADKLGKTAGANTLGMTAAADKLDMTAGADKSGKPAGADKPGKTADADKVGKTAGADKSGKAGGGDEPGKVARLDEPVTTASTSKAGKAAGQEKAASQEKAAGQEITAKAARAEEQGKAGRPSEAVKAAGVLESSRAASLAKSAETDSEAILKALEPEILVGRKHGMLNRPMTRRGILAALVVAPIAYATPRAFESPSTRGAANQKPVAAQAAPVFTIDVSQHDWKRRGGNLGWAEIHRAGIAGMCARATYGDPTGYHWPTYHFGNFSRAAKEAGMGLRGGYHNLVRGDQASINRQVDWLRRELDRYDADWAMLDVERYSELVKADMWPLWEDVRRFDDRWSRVETRVLVGYIPPWNWSKHLGQPDLREFRGPLIASNYPRQANEEFKELYEKIGGNDGRGWAEYGSRVPEGWQYSSRAKVPGVSDICDVNAWRLNFQQLKTLLTGTIQAA